MRRVAGLASASASASASALDAGSDASFAAVFDSMAADGIGGGVGGSGGVAAGSAATGFFVLGLRGGLGDSVGLGPGGAGGASPEAAAAKMLSSNSLMLIGFFFTPTSFFNPSAGLAGGFGGDIILSICASSSATLIGAFFGLAALASTEAILALFNIESMRALLGIIAGDGAALAFALPRPAPFALAKSLLSFSGSFGCTTT